MSQTDLKTYFQNNVAGHAAFEAFGLAIEELGPGNVVVRLPHAGPEHLGGGGEGNVLNGGIIAAMFDFALGGAVGSALIARSKKPEKDLSKMRFATINLNISYLRMAFGGCFEVHASIVRVGCDVAFAEAKLHDEKKRVCATATGSFSVFL